MGSPIDTSELAAAREELRQTKHQLAMFHDSWKQAKQACEAWKKEAEGAANLESKLREMEGKVRSLQSGVPLRALAEGADVSRLPFSKLESIQQQLRGELERVEAVSIAIVQYCYLLSFAYNNEGESFANEQNSSKLNAIILLNV